MMDFKQELAQFRQGLAQYKKEMVPTEVPEESVSPDAIWADEIPMPQMGMGMPQPEAFTDEVNVPDVLTDTDSRFTGDVDADNQAFMDFMMNDPMFQQHQPEMEAILEEVISQAADPENPMTEEEAQQLFLEMMTERFGQDFQ